MGSTILNSVSVAPKPRGISRGLTHLFTKFNAIWRFVDPLLCFPMETSPVSFPCGSAGKGSACNVGDLGSIPGLGRSLGEGKGHPLQYCGLENSIWLFWCFPGGSDSKASACNSGDLGLIPGSGRSPGEGKGYRLQYSCLESSMERGAWRAAVHGVTESQTRLSDFTLFLSLYYVWVTPYYVKVTMRK